MFKARGLIKMRGKQRTDSTHVLGAVHDLHLLELVGETLRATLNDLAAVVPEWVRQVARPSWFERYAHRIEDCRLPKGQDKRNEPPRICRRLIGLSYAAMSGCSRAA
jgi:transposase